MHRQAQRLGSVAYASTTGPVVHPACHCRGAVHPACLPAAVHSSPSRASESAAPLTYSSRGPPLTQARTHIPHAPGVPFGAGGEQASARATHCHAPSIRLLCYCHTLLLTLRGITPHSTLQGSQPPLTHSPPLCAHSPHLERHLPPHHTPLSTRMGQM